MDPSAAWFYEGQLCLHRNWDIAVDDPVAWASVSLSVTRAVLRGFIVLPG